MKIVYIDEDPNTEDQFFCPKCAEINKQNNVRYMYINLDEAIFKCEGMDCMFPYRNFKFKNYKNNTVYRYVNEQVEECPDISTLEYNMELLSATDSTLENLILETSCDLDLLKTVENSSPALDEDFLNDFLNKIGSDTIEANYTEPQEILRKSRKLLESAKNAHIFKIPPLPGLGLSPKKKRRNGRKNKKSSPSKKGGEMIPKYEKVRPLNLVKEISLLRSKEHQTDEERGAKAEQIKRFMNFIDRSLEKGRDIIENPHQVKRPKKNLIMLTKKPIFKEVEAPIVDTPFMERLPDLF